MNARYGLRRMSGRDRAEPFRAASPLELLFDLVFVIAVSQAAGGLHEQLSAGRVGAGVLGYLMVFFAVWWAWMNFTWFASAFDTDDWAYRVMTIVQMAGALILAAGVHDAMTSYDFTLVTWGYVVMRLAMVAQWARAAASDPGVRRTALTMAIGVSIVQLLWLARLMLPPAAGFVGFFVLMLAELAVPMIAERGRGTAWHPGHIADRYGCFTLIVLGESVLASATAVFGARDAAHPAVLAGYAAAGLLVAAGMWWVYFSREQGERLASRRSGFGFGYVHYLLFAAAGAVSAGIGAGVDLATGAGRLGEHAVAAALAVPVGVFVLMVWAIMLRGSMSPVGSALVVALAVLILACLLVPRGTVPAVVVLLAGIVAVLEADAHRQGG